MLITKLTLHKYKRLSLTNITTLTITPNKKIIMIIAKNGSGKSSTLYELSPLPANLKHYYDNGYKEIEISHNQNEYILSSGKVAKNKHSFIVNGVELNKSGTKKIQSDLVLEHFNYTVQIHEVMMNLKPFTSMSVSDRKKWFTSISDIDYTYPISVWENIKKRTRDITGGIKILQNKLAREEMDVISEDQKLKLKEDLVIYNKFLDNLLSSRVNISTNSIDIDIEKELNYLTQEATKLINNKVLDTELDIDTLPSIKEKYKLVVDNIAEYEQDMKRASVLEITVSDTIEQDYNNKVKEIDRLTNTIYIDNIVNNIDSVYNSFIDLYGSIVELLNEYMMYNDLTLTREELITIHETVRTTKEKIDIIKIDLNRKKIKLEEEEKKKEIEITCPSCNNKFYNGYDESYVNRLEKEIKEYELDINKLTTIINEHNGTISKYEKKKHILSRIEEIIKYKPSEAVYNYILSNSSKDKVNLLYSIKEDMLKWIKLTELNSELTELQKLLRVSQVQKDILEAKQLENKEKLEHKLHNLLLQKDKLSKQIEEIEKKKRVIEQLKQYDVKIASLLKLNRKKLKRDIALLKNEKINDIIRIIRTEIADIENKINNDVYINKNIAKLKKEIEEYKEKEKLLKLVGKEMSPTEGLIAKSISSFLSMFMSSMNEIINEVWSYDLEVLPCKIDNSNDLDYKFPIVIDGNIDDMGNDVSEGSTSMLEIIDLAFRIVSMQYLGLETYPLYLDEFSKTMDPKHRLSVYDAIDRLSESSFNQIFIISHFESMYARFKSNTDLVVLTEDNMMLDKKMVYNEIVTIE